MANSYSCEKVRSRNETKEIWRSIKGASALLDRYGYYPTLHGAFLTDLDVKFNDRDVSLTFEYSDLNVNEVSVSTKLRMIWTDVSKAEVYLYANHAYHMSFQKAGNELISQFDQGSGLHGSISSAGIEVDEVAESEAHRDSDYIHTPIIRLG